MINIYANTTASYNIVDAITFFLKIFIDKYRSGKKGEF